MQKTNRISIAAIATLMLAVLAVNLAWAATSLGTQTNVSAASANVRVMADNVIAISPQQAEDPEQLKKLIPVTIAEAEKNIYPIRTRFLMWTRDGLHIMWGIYGKGHFVGTDNLGKQCWGIYGRGVFAGFYDGEFFWGKYVNGAWKAQYLFGLASSYGKYVTFPQITVASISP